MLSKKERRLAAASAASGAFDLEVHDVVELCVPAHMLVRLIESLKKSGQWELRRDLLATLNKSMASTFQRLAPLKQTMAAKQVDEHAEALLSRLNPVDLRQALYATSVWIVKLLEEGLYRDKTHQAALTAMLIAVEAQEDGSWQIHEKQAVLDADRLLTEARRRGLYRAIIFA